MADADVKRRQREHDARLFRDFEAAGGQLDAVAALLQSTSTFGRVPDRGQLAQLRQEVLPNVGDRRILEVAQLYSEELRRARSRFDGLSADALSVVCGGLGAVVGALRVAGAALATPAPAYVSPPRRTLARPILAHAAVSVLFALSYRGLVVTAQVVRQQDGMLTHAASGGAAACVASLPMLLRGGVRRVAPFAFGFGSALGVALYGYDAVRFHREVRGELHSGLAEQLLREQQQLWGKKVPVVPADVAHIQVVDESKLKEA